MDDRDARIEALETRVAHGERTIEELNDVLTRQWQQIDRLTKQMAAINDQLANVEHMARSGHKDAPPPHY